MRTLRQGGGGRSWPNAVTVMSVKPPCCSIGAISFLNVEPEIERAPSGGEQLVARRVPDLHLHCRGLVQRVELHRRVRSSSSVPSAAVRRDPLIRERARQTSIQPLHPIASYPHEGSALVVWDSGQPVQPPENVPTSAGEDPHSDPRNSPVARHPKAAFLQPDGDVIDVCAQGALHRASRLSSVHSGHRTIRCPLSSQHNATSQIRIGERARFRGRHIPGAPYRSGAKRAGGVLYRLRRHGRSACRRSQECRR